MAILLIKEEEDEKAICSVGCIRELSSFSDNK